MSYNSPLSTMMIAATAPAKTILFGEHAVNRGATALAVSVGLRATCVLSQEQRTKGKEQNSSHAMLTLMGGGHTQAVTRQAVLELGAQIDGWRAAQDYVAIQRLAAEDFFAPAKYVLAGSGEQLPTALGIRFESEIPPGAGLGSGGALFVALASALAALLGENNDPRRITKLAQRGDIVAHGGVASGLDTQTSLYGGAIRYTAAREGEPIDYADGLALVIGNTGVFAATSVVNGRVREWLVEHPVRVHYFAEIGMLARHAEAALREGDWPELGRLMNLNQLVLERIGVSCPELAALNDAALQARALGAKLSGSGGGGIMIALVTPDTAEPVARAIQAAGGTPIIAPVGVAGAKVMNYKL